MPLLLNGARQVGKTHTALTFGKSYYKNTVYFNMEDSSEIPLIFERDLDPDRIVRELAVKAGMSIFKGDTLIILDEIQACGRALTSLKYFCENAPDYHIIAAGSLLGVALNREKYSFPVGKVEMLTLYPLDFEEFLWATNRKDLCDLIQESYQTFSPLSLHETAMDSYKTYLVVGGMPRVVTEYVEKYDFDFVLAMQKSLNDSYIADMAKYASPQETTRIMAAWASVPAQLAKENHKFQYTRNRLPHSWRGITKIHRWSIHPAIWCEGCPLWNAAVCRASRIGGAMAWRPKSLPKRKSIGGQRCLKPIGKSWELLKSPRAGGRSSSG